MILVVDDMQMIVEWLVIAISDLGYHCDCSMDARSALFKIERICYSMVLIDIGLPGQMDGNNLARSIKSLPYPYCDIPLVAMSGDLKKIAPDLFCAALKKPFLPADLRAVVSAHALPPIYHDIPEK